MLLIKCSCNCHSTIKDDFFSKNQTFYKCPNCMARLDVSPYTELISINGAVEKSGFRIYSIPDSTYIEFKFNIN